MMGAPSEVSPKPAPRAAHPVGEAGVKSHWSAWRESRSLRRSSHLPFHSRTPHSPTGVVASRSGLAAPPARIPRKLRAIYAGTKI